jgi:hypothetical protein
MFEQSPTVGPGIGSVTEHGFEIFIMLAGMLLLGVTLMWLLGRKTTERLRHTLAELHRTRERLAAAERRAQPQARLRQANPGSGASEHEQTLGELRNARLELANAKARIRELEQNPAHAETVSRDAVEAALPFIQPRKPKSP